MLRKRYERLHYVKSVFIRSFTGPYFPAFRMNTERYYCYSFFDSSSYENIKTKFTLKFIVKIRIMYMFMFNWPITEFCEIKIDLLVFIWQKQPPEVFTKKCNLKSFAKFTGKHLFQSLLFNEVAGFSACSFIKKETYAQVFPCEFWEIFKSTFFTEHLRTTTSDLSLSSLTGYWNSDRIL